MKYIVFALALFVGCAGSVSYAAEGIQQPAQQGSCWARMRTRLASYAPSPVALKQTLVLTAFLCATEAGIGLPYGDVEHMVYIPAALSSIAGVLVYHHMKSLPPIRYKYIVTIGSLSSAFAWLGSKIGMDSENEPKIASFYGLGFSSAGTLVGGILAKWQYDQEQRRQRLELLEALLEEEREIV